MGALEERVLGLEARWALVVVDEAGPAGVDLLAGQPRPLAGVALAQERLDHDRADPDGLADDGRGVGRPLEVGGDDDVDGADHRRSHPGLAATEIRERHVGLSLPAPERVPLGLAMADEQHSGHPPAR